MRLFLFLISALMISCDADRSGSGPTMMVRAASSAEKPGCKHSEFIDIDAGTAYDTTATSLSLLLNEPVENATYRLIADGKENERSGVFDEKGHSTFWTTDHYNGEYFLEIKAPGREPLMLQAIRLKGGRKYIFTICLAAGTQLRHFKYLGENKNYTGVVEDLN